MIPVAGRHIALVACILATCVLGAGDPGAFAQTSTDRNG